MWQSARAKSFALWGAWVFAMSNNTLKWYKSKVVRCGAVVYVSSYEKPVCRGFLGRSGRVYIGASAEDKKKNIDKRFFRARREIRQCVNTNILPSSKFLTLTYGDNVQDLSRANKDFKHFIKRLNYSVYGRSCARVQYLCVPEFQKRGAVHYHLVLFNLPYIPARKLADLWGWGYVRINRIKAVDNVGAYVCKYLSKDSARTSERLAGRKCFFRSCNLRSPEVSVYPVDSEKLVSKGVNLSSDNFVYERFYETEHYGRVCYREYNSVRKK